ncbi:MAG: glycogen/starch synthase [Longimicrobiales bacterium]
MVHLTGEYWPYARTGGLAEAVRGIAAHRASAGGPTLVCMPLYRVVRERFPDQVVPCSDWYQVRMGPRIENARLWHHDVGGNTPRVLFIEHDGFFGRDHIYGTEHGAYPDNHVRFAFFCLAALKALQWEVPGAAVVHAHDWHAALAPVFARTVLQQEPYFRDLTTVLTVHNAGYQGHYGPEILGELGLPGSLFRMDRMEWYGKVNLLKGGLVFSDVVTTVSPTHARELRTRTGGFGLHDTFSALQDRFVGILNGIDYTVWDPASDGAIEATFHRDDLSGKVKCKAWLQEAAGLPVRPDVPLFGMTARLAQQKGFDLIIPSRMTEDIDAQWIFLGEGEARYRHALQEMTERRPDRVAAFFDFNEEREHRVLAGADFLLMPSLYEPCGLTQMRAQRYGALPVVRRVGGLADTVEDRVTGFLFDEYETWALEEAVRYAADLYADRAAWEEHVREAMTRDFSWMVSAARYEDMYNRAQQIHRGPHA